MQKTILVDAWKTFITEEGVNKQMEEMLNKFENRKIILTSANEEQKQKLGIVDMPYEVFTLEHNPEKSDPEYYKIMLEHFSLKAEDVVYFEHSQEVVEAAKSVGIISFYYDENKKDVEAVEEFLKKNI